MLAIKGLAGGRPGLLPGWRLFIAGTGRMIRAGFQMCHATNESVSSIRSSSLHPLVLTARCKLGALPKKPGTRSANFSGRKFGSFAASKPLRTRCRWYIQGSSQVRVFDLRLAVKTHLEGSECPSKRVISARESCAVRTRGPLEHL